MDQPILSILIPSLPERSLSLASLYSELSRQILACPDMLIEILMDTRPMEIATGIKRNDLFANSCGKYVCYHDDDDCPAADYIKSLGAGCMVGKACVTFDMEHTQAGKGRVGYANFSLDYVRNFDDRDPSGFVRCERIPNHLCPIRRDLIAHQAKSKGVDGKPFPPIWRGEDHYYAKMMRPVLDSEFHIDRVLYEYKRPRQ